MEEGILTTRTYLPDDVALVVFNSQWMAADLGPHPHQLIVRPPVAGADYRTPAGGRRRRTVTLVNLYQPKGGGMFWELARRMPDVDFLGVEGAYGDQVDEGPLPNVELVAHTPDMRAVYARTRVLLMPSRYESWGRVGVEAMCSGIPVLANPTPGLVESLGAAGTFVDLDDVDGWETELRRLLDGPAWKAASAAALARAGELDPAEDLAAWVERVEALA